MTADYPEDWQEQGWCCRECAAMSWYSIPGHVRRMLSAGDQERSAPATEAVPVPGLQLSLFDLGIQGPSGDMPGQGQAAPPPGRPR